jgi:hypothetical protein
MTFTGSCAMNEILLTYLNHNQTYPLASQSEGPLKLRLLSSFFAPIFRGDTRD